MPPTPSRFAKPLLAASLLLLAGSAVVAVVEPGDLGEDTGTEGAQGQVTSTTSTSLPATTAAPGVTTTTVAAGGVTATTATSTTAAPGASATTATTAPGSGLGTSGNSRADDATAPTGMESLLGPALALAATGGVLRRAGRRL